MSDYVDNDTAKPLVLRKVQKPVFKFVESVFDEEALLIKQELNDEDNVSNSVTVNEKNTVKRPMTVDSIYSQMAHSKLAINKAETELSKGAVKRKPKIVTFITTVKTVEANAAVKGDPTATFECAVNTDDTKSRNRNGKINRGKNGKYVKSAPRKLCNNRGSSHHLTNVCKNDVVTPINAVKINGNLHRTPIIDRSMNVCSDIDCMPCKITAMSTVFNPPILSTTKCSYLCDVETPEPTNASSKATPTKKKVVPFSKSLWVKRDVKNLVVHDLDVVDETLKFEPNDDATSSNDVTA